MIEQITLTGQTQYNERFAPSNAKKGYVARITGRTSGPMKYEREFLGQEADLLDGDQGLYEKQRGDKKGGYTRWYHVLLSHPEHGLILSIDCENEVPKIAKLLDDGHQIEDIVEVTNLRPSAKHEGRMVFDVQMRTAAQVRKVAKSATIDGATESCWETLCGLPAVEAKKVLTELRKRLEV